MKRALLILIILSLLLTGGGSIEAVSVRTKADVNGAVERDFMPGGIKSEADTKENVAVSMPVLPAASKPEADISEPSQVIEPTRVAIVAAGDLMCLSVQLSAAWKNGGYRFDYCFRQIKDKISGADLAICNLETLVAKGYKYTERSPSHGSPQLNAPVSYLSAAVKCGFDVFINANNHILDHKTDGLNKTIKKLNEFGVLHTGAYASGKKRSPLITDVKGIKIAVLGYTDHVNGYSGKLARVDKYSKKLVKADIKAAKTAGADYVIVYMHWGKENTHKVNKTQKKTAAFIAKAGADIIIGSHPHCTQGTQIIKTDHGPVPVFYSLGNLVSSMGRTINRDSVLVNIVLEKDSQTGAVTLAKLTYTPTYCTNTRAGNFVIMPAGRDSIAQSKIAKALKSSRARTVNVLKNKVAAPE